MKILTTLTYYAPHWTGLTVYAQRIAEGLAARGHEVSVLTSRYQPELPAREEIGGVDVHRVPTVGRLSRAVVMPRFPAEARRMIAGADVVHVHSPMPEAGLVVRLTRRAGPASVVTHQGDVVMPAGALNHLVQAAMNVSLGSAVRHADAVATHNDDYAAHSRLLARRAGAASGSVAGIEPPTTIPEPDQASVAEWRSELGLGDRRIVAFAGRFVEEKGFDCLLRAVPRIRAAVPDVHFVFAGETDVVYEPAFYARCLPLIDANADCITQLGLLRDRRRLADFYAMADVFVLPSRTDCFAAVQVEALLCGTPVVAADIPGARSVVARTGFGRLVPPGDPAALAAGVIDELTTFRRRPDRRAVTAAFDPELAIDRYEQLLDDAVSRRGTGASPARRIAPTAGAALAERDRETLTRLLKNEADVSFRRRALRAIELLDLHDGERVLDAGCGMGVVSMLMAAVRDVSIVAVDGDIERLDWARREHVRADLAVVDLAALPFPDAVFDKILAAEVIEHLADDVGGVAEIARVLRPGGTLVVTVPHANYPAAWDPYNKVLELFGLPPRTAPGGFTGQWSGHQRLYLPRELATVIERTGLVIETVEEHTAHTVPFNHVLVYGVGKPLIEHDLLPAALRRSVDRFRAGDVRSSRRNLIDLAVAELQRFDRRNDHLDGSERRFTQIVAAAVKP